MGNDTIPGPFEAYCEATQPAPAPLPEGVEADLEEATNVLRKVQEVLRNEDLLFAAEGLRCVFHVLSRHTAQARRLAEAEDTTRWETNKRKCAEARVRELEGCISAAVRGLREFFPGVELAQNIADTLEKNATEASA